MTRIDPMADKPRFLVAGNWKMNGDREGAQALVRELLDLIAADGAPACDMLVCPPAILIGLVGGAVRDTAIDLGAQDCHTDGAGAHTGDISASMVADAGCAYVIVGHSERRADHGEGDALVRAKAEAALEAGLTPIICLGETLAERDAGRAVEVVLGQLNGSLPEGATAENAVIAYEPVWAIGTGRVPTGNDIAEVHDALRAGLARRMAAADGMRILYGGSVKPDNAPEILAIQNVNGALVGGASLKAQDFWGICRSCV
jgi:triosephosphate isomerase (TIM)